MQRIEKVIDQVAGSMAIEGFTLSEENKERIRNLVSDPEGYETTLQELIRKHTATGDDLIDFRPSTLFLSRCSPSL